MDWLETLLVSTILLLLVCLVSRPRKFPPGPYPLPLAGNLLSIALVPGPTKHDVLWTLSKRHGPIMGLMFGPQPAVVISGYRAVSHVLGRDDLAYRPTGIPVHTRCFGKRLGLILTDGPVWREQRRFTLRHLRDFGFGRRSMESLIHEEARGLVDAVDAHMSPNDPNGIDLLHLFPLVAVNVLWAIMAGERNHLFDQRFNQMTKAIFEFFRLGNQTSVVGNYPILQSIPILNSSYMNQLNIAKEVRSFIELTIEDHSSTYDENNMRDFIDVYLKEIKNSSDPSFERSQLSIICMDLLSAGSETTASTLGYCLRYLVQHPRVQTEMRAELTRVVGTERLPAMDDLPSLHYTQAVLAETLRHSGLVPLTPPHATPQEINLFGYRVPKDSLIIINLWSVHMDSHIWGDPENFRPERFIKDGIFYRDKHFIPFGLGPRVCLGEPLARYTAILFIATLVQHFEFSIPPQGPAPSNEQLPGFTTAPAPFNVSVKRLITLPLPSPDSGVGLDTSTFTTPT